MSKKSVLVLNAGFEPIHRVTPQHAVRMFVRGVAEFHEVDEGRPFGPFFFPISMHLHRYVKLSWYYDKPVVWSKSGVMRRDGYKCVYCGQTADTIDHVLPASRGGNSSWTNTVASCFRCNNKKDNKTPVEAGMKMLVRPPFVPRREQLIASFGR